MSRPENKYIKNSALLQATEQVENHCFRLNECPVEKEPPFLPDGTRGLLAHTHTLPIPPEAAGQRLDRFCGENIAHVSREKIKKAIQNGACRVQGLTVTTPGARLVPGQTVELKLAQPLSNVQPEEGAIAPLWQDEHLLILDKPAGITVHPCPSCPQGTLVQRLASHFPQLMQQEGQRPGIVHRLDKDTSGLLAVALTEIARLQLSADFAARHVDKEYLALVRGVPPLEGQCHEPLGRHPLVKVKMAVVAESKGGRAAHSEWRVLYADPARRFALVAVRIHTGRTHQIRVHMAHVGFPLWGDRMYGLQDNTPDPAPRQMLHAWQLTLPHPVTGESLSFACSPPPDMLETALSLNRRTCHAVITGLPGCGKSTLLHLWEAQGVPVWSADAVVATLYAPGGHGHDFLRTRFGDRFVSGPRAQVDRAALRQAMGEDSFLRQEVEEAVHALVRADLHRFWTEAEASNTPVTAAEVPLFLEKGWRVTSNTDKDACKSRDIRLVGVPCPPAQRHTRLEQRRGWTQAQCVQVDGWQWAEERKMEACQYIVDNSGTEQTLTASASAMLTKLRKLRDDEETALRELLQSLWRV